MPLNPRDLQGDAPRSFRPNELLILEQTSAKRRRK
jgi:hypothetical protein